MVEEGGYFTYGRMANTKRGQAGDIDLIREDEVNRGQLAASRSARQTLDVIVTKIYGVWSVCGKHNLV